MAKKSVVLRVNRAVHYPSNFQVFFTRHQHDKLPGWVTHSLRFYDDYDNPRHCYMWVEAKDELQAMMRFEKLWAALPKEEE